MNFKKISASLLSAALLAGCSAGSTASSASTASKKIDTLKMQFVPSRDAETIMQTTSGLPDLLKAQMKDKGYDISNIEITVGAGSDYNVTGEALASGSVDVAWLPASTYANYSDDTTVALTATRDQLSNDSTDPKTWNGTANETKRVSGTPVTYYRGLLYAGPSENGKKIAAKVAAGQELTWDDLNSCNWAVASTTSSSGYVFPTLWLMDKYNGKTIADLAHTTQLSYPQAFAQAAAGTVDIVLCYADGRMDYSELWTKPTTETDSKGAQGFGRTASIYDEMQVFAVTDKIFNDTVSLTKKPVAGHEVVATDDFKKAFQDSMISIAGTDEGKKIFAVYSHTGYVIADAANYDSLKTGLETVAKANK